VPLGVLNAIERLADVLRIEAIVRPMVDVTSQGASAHGSPNWNLGGYSGTGVKVGIIDGGFQGYSSLIGTELPTPAAVRCYTAAGVFTNTIANCQTDTDHGTAVPESVVDVAPGVTLYLSQPYSDLDLQNTVVWMISQGVQVINKSQSHEWDGPGDGTSSYADSPLKAVDQAIAGNIVWVNSAGNTSGNGWTGAWTDVDGDNHHEFAPVDNGLYFSATPGENLWIQMRWEDSWTASARDYDLYLFQLIGEEWTQIAQSESVQDGTAGSTPYESISMAAPAETWYAIALTRFEGDIPSWMQVATFRQSVDKAILSNSISNPGESSNPGLLAVGAANWQTTSTIEEFSGLGPTRNNRSKPDIVGADASDTVNYGTNGFYGTSQASPHVAGLAALVRNRFPAYTPAQVAQYLRDNAQARGAVPNNTWGYGFALLPPIEIDTTPPTTSVPNNYVVNRYQIGQTVASGTTFYSARVRVSWTSPATDIDRFHLHKSLDNGVTWTTVPLGSPSATSVELTIPFGKVVKFRVRGVDTSNNTGAWVVSPASTLTGRQDNASSVVYTNTWNGPSTLAGAYGGNVKYSGINGRSASITFTGKQFSWVSTLGPDLGKAEVWLGATKLGMVDLYSPTTKPRMIVFSKAWTTSATRTIEIRVLGQKTLPSTATRVDIDGYLFR